MDRLSPEDRSQNMRRIRSKNTRPEIVVRALLRALGRRYRLHRTDLPGKPDIVFPGAHKAIFVHGCFWHQHTRCCEGRPPKTRQEYWIPKLKKNCDRDNFNRRRLGKMGWRSLVVWECEIKDEEKLSRRLARFLAD